MYFEPDLWSDEFRGCGRTTDQLLGAPERAVFVCTGDPHYTERLARDLGRADVNVVNMSWIRSERYCGRRLSALVIDHHTQRTMSYLERDLVDRARAYVRARNPH